MSNKQRVFIHVLFVNLSERKIIDKMRQEKSTVRVYTAEKRERKIWKAMLQIRNVFSFQMQKKNKKRKKESEMEKRKGTKRCQNENGMVQLRKRNRVTR